MRKMVRWDRSCVVVSEYWPSWTFALQSLGAQKLETWMPVAQSASLRELKETCVGGTLRHGDEQALRKSAEQGRWKGWLFFLQGSASFVDKVRSILRVVKGARMIGVVVIGSAKMEAELGKVLPWAPASSITVKHSQAGGVTRGTWRVFSDLKLHSLKSSQVKRVLRNILVSTESGVEVNADQVGKGSPFITKDQRIDVRQRHIRLAVPSCFARDPDNLVERDIADKELMAAYDMDEGVIKALGAYSKHTGKPLSRDYVMEAPLKVLHSIGRMVKEADVAWSTEGISADDNVEAVSESVSSGQKSKRKCLESLEISDKQARTTVDSQTGGPKSQVATKSDDAPVEVTDWDIWTVDNFEPPEVSYSKSSLKSKVLFKEVTKAKILICKPGSYDPEKHGRLFDALRVLLLRRARQNALKGLIAYMRNKYGSKLVLTSVAEHNRKVRNDERGKESGQGSKARSQHPRRNYKRSRHRSRGHGLDPEVEWFKDAKVGCDALRRLAYSSWWSWDVGSTLLFWRWPRRYQRSVRDGTKLFVKKEQLPHHFKR